MLGALWYLFGMGETPITNTETMTERMQERMSMKHSLRDFLTMSGESMKCTYVSDDGGVRTVGTTYVANGKVRSDSTMTTSATGEAVTSSAIIDGTYMYAWGDEMPEGVKMSMSVMNDMQAQQGGMMKSHAKDYDTAYDYECESWNADQSFFAPPAGIAFTDYSEMMQSMGGMMQQMQGGTDAGMMDGEMMMDHNMMGGMNGGAPPEEVRCAACAHAPDAESKAQCMAALGCQ